MYIKNSPIITKFKGIASYQNLCISESFVLRNCLLLIYKHVSTNVKQPLKKGHNANGLSKAVENIAANIKTKLI